MASSVAAEAAPLPSRLMNFFAKYPPKLYSAHFTGQTIPTIRQKIAKEGNKKLEEQARSSSEEISTPMPSAQDASQTDLSDLSLQDEAPTAPELLSSESSSVPVLSARSSKLPPNPFLPYRNPANGRWRGAHIGLRRQAELVKLAKKHGVESLLPAGRKSSAFKQERALERGLAVKGTGEGQKVKGHKWERMLPSKLEKRTNAMEGMPELIREWEQRGRGAGWKKWPK